MKLHLATQGGKNLFTGYGDGYVVINSQRYEHAVIVTPDAVHAAWNDARFDTLAASHLQAILTLEPEIVVLGTGKTQRFLRPQLMREFAAANIGVEIMDTRAACRTYNILMAEGRNVIAAILLE